MTNKEYHKKTEYVSKSLLDLMHKSPAHYKAYIEGEEKPATPALIFGSLVHSVVFEQDDYVVAPVCDRRTKEGKLIYEQFIEESKDKLIVTAEQLQQAQNIKNAVLAHPKAKALIQSEGKAEISYFKEMHGVKCKCRADYHNTKYNIVIDLKTTQNSSPSEFARSVYNYRYHVQAAFYLDLIGAKHFIFIAVEKEPPYNVELYELDDEAIEAGRQEYLKDIETYKECLKTDTWHGYTTEQKINILSLPAWALK